MGLIALATAIAFPLSLLIGEAVAPARGLQAGADQPNSQGTDFGPQPRFLASPGALSFRTVAGALLRQPADGLATSALVNSVISARNMAHLVVVARDFTSHDPTITSLGSLCSSEARCVLIDDGAHGGMSGWVVRGDRGFKSLPQLHTDIASDPAVRALAHGLSKPYGIYLFDSNDVLYCVWALPSKNIAHDIALVIGTIRARPPVPPITASPLTAAVEPPKAPQAQPTEHLLPQDRARTEKASSSAEILNVRHLSGVVIKTGERSTSVPFNRSWAVQQAQTDRQALLVVFWATWCIPCLKEMPTIEEIQHRFSRPVRFVGLVDDSNTTDTAAEMAKALSGSSFTTQYLVPDGVIARTIFRRQDVPLPAFALFDRRGALRLKLIGSVANPVNYASLIKALEEVTHEH